MKDNNINLISGGWIEINVEHLLHNIALLKKFLSPKTQFMFIVKANAYGCGLKGIARTSSPYVDKFGVARIEEAIMLRKQGIKKDILNLGFITPLEAHLLIKYDIIQSVSNVFLLTLLNNIGSQYKKVVRVHINVDTGINRTGIKLEEINKFMSTLKKCKWIYPEGIFTHYHSPSSRYYTKIQTKLFKQIIDYIYQKYKVCFKYIHAASSIAAVLYPWTHFNMVRAGILIYGGGDEKARSLGFKEILTLKAIVSSVKRASKGESVGYERTFRLKRDSYLATIQIGYADGVRFLLSNKARVLINGRSFPVVGRISMDQLMVDLGNYCRVKPSDVAVLIGRDKDENISLQEVASLAKTIDYEILSGLGPRLARYYILKEKVVYRESYI